MISVQNDFTDSEGAGTALFQKGLSATFPNSLAAFNSTAGGNSSAVALLDALKAENISAAMSSDWTATITLPSVLVKDGVSYMGPAGGIPLLIEGTGAPRENVTSMNVSVDIEAVGSKITRITAVNPV